MSAPLPEMPQNLWLDPAAVDFRGQESPPRWHAALTAVLKLRPPATQAQTGYVAAYRNGYRDALMAVHETIAKGINSS